MHQHLVVALRHAHRREDGAGGVRAHQQVDLVGGDQLLVQRARQVGLGLVVLEHPLDRPAEQAAALVELLDVDLADELVDLRRGRERPGQRQRAADADRLAGGAAPMRAGAAAARRKQRRAEHRAARHKVSMFMGLVSVRWRILQFGCRISSSCSPSVGGGRTSSARSPSNDTGERTVRNSPITGCSADAMQLQVLAPAGRAAPRWCRTSARAARPARSQPRAPLGARCAARSFAPSSSISASWFSMRASRVAKRGSSNRPGCSIACARPCQNFSGDDMCSAIHLPSAHSQHVRLRDARPAVRAHHLVGLEEVREGVEVEVRHRLEHRHLDRAADSRAAALEQRAEHAVGGVEAGQRIGDRRADDARVLGVDQQLQEAARRLRHGVVAGRAAAGPVAPKPLIEQ